ncbi:MAG: response regulator [Bacteroidales bacterium]|nr:response regulator [Bacteroidales bacterium]
MFNSIQESLEKGYVLVAEDSLVQAKKLKRFFESKNIRCLTCKNGEEAYEAATKEKPELIVSDIVMPVMDGYEFCKKTKANSNLSDIPFIILTSLNDPMDIIKGLQAGADNFLTKPYDEDYLLTRINYLMANRHIRKMGSGDMNIEIMFQNQRFEINSDKKQILDLLLSVYEAAINRNEQLIEAQRKLEELNESLRNANQELEAFTRTVSHDLRSPISGILSFASLLEEIFEEEAK